MPGMVGELIGADEVVVVVVASVVVKVVVVSVVLEPLSVSVPITQYNLLVSRLGQEILGFSCWSSATDSPQVLAKLSQVSDLVAVVVKEHSTPRRERAKTKPGMSPAAARCASCILLNVIFETVGEAWKGLVMYALPVDALAILPALN